MEYELIDSSGTDDDLPSLHHNRVPIPGHVIEDGRPVISSLPFPRIQTDMESQIHYLEQEAYRAVLRAFKAQSDALTWEKEGLITELRKELRVSDDEHRELLNKVNADNVICRIREWRKTGTNRTAMLNAAQSANDELQSPTVSASHKRHKTSQSASMAYGMPTQALHLQSIPSATQPLFSTTNLGSALGAGGKKPRPGQLMTGNVPMKPTEYHSTGQSPRGRLNIHNSGSTHLMCQPPEAAACDPLIGRKVMIRWPSDNFYEAVIADFNPTEGRHALVYDRNTPNETWEWVTLKEIPQEDIRWVDDNPGVLQQGGHAEQGFEHSMNHDLVPGNGRGRELTKVQYEKQVPATQNGATRKDSSEIEILNTETLIKEVEKMFDESHLDLLQIEKTKKMLKDHEQALIDVIAKLADVADSESDGERRVSHKHLMSGEQG